jgi:hypothetical protein
MRRWFVLGLVVVLAPVVSASAANLDVTSNSAKVEQITVTSTPIIDVTTSLPGEPLEPAATSTVP